MKATIHVEPHEKFEAIEAYGDFLSLEQIEKIEEVEGSLTLIIDTTARTAEVRTNHLRGTNAKQS